LYARLILGVFNFLSRFMLARMFGPLRILLLSSFMLIIPSRADHVVVTGGPALRKWENYRVPQDQHDRFWANFVRASTLRMDEIRKAYGPSAPIVWMVYQPSYQTRAREDGKSYTAWVSEIAAKRRISLIWFSSGGGFIQSLNSRPSGSIQSFDFFGHSNRYAFMFDYSNEIMAVSTAWLHERDLPRIRSSVFARNAYCKSWGCHTGESMSKVWKRSTGVALEGANGPTDYTVISYGRLPEVHGSWAR
jgi:hypothetical protein